MFLVEGAYTHGLKNRDSILQGNIEVGVGDIDIHALQCHEHLLSKVELARGDCDPLERGVVRKDQGIDRRVSVGDFDELDVLDRES